LVINVHFLYATEISIKQTKMKKPLFLFLICFVLQFALNTSIYSATKNATVKFNSVLKQANTGNPKAMFLVARLYEQGKGTSKNLKAASKWYQKSASQNYAAANARLGKMYLEGISVKKNISKAFSLLNLAAIQGIPVAQFNLAILYELGVGTKKDLQEAIKWYDFAAKGGYFTAKGKSNSLKKRLGISPTSIASIESRDFTSELPTQNPASANDTQKIISQNESELQSVNQDDFIDIAIKEPQELIEEKNDSISVPELTSVTPEPEAEKTIEPSQQKVAAAKITITPINDNQPAKNEKPDIEEQALLSNTFERTENEPTNATLKTNKLTRQQKIALIKAQNIKRTLKTLLAGRWFEKNRPVNYLPSPKAQCNIINQIDIKCISRELQRHTDKETVFYKTLGKISKLTSTGKFLIQYQNTVVRVIADKVVNEDGVLYQSKIKTGLQKKIHQLNCQYQDISNLICIKDNAQKYNFKNRAIVDRNN